jgi:hypothetical protein
MTCSIPLGLLIQRRMEDGSVGWLIAPDLPTALSDIIRASDSWTAERITLGNETVMEGDDLVQAVRLAAQRLPHGEADRDSLGSTDKDGR